MYAIIRLGDGRYYTSVVFGYYCPVTATDDYQRYLERIHNQYYLVLNEGKDKLVKQYVFDKSSKYLNPFVLITDGNYDDWNVDAEGHGCISFLSDVDSEHLDAERLQRCIDIDSAYKFDEYPEIKTARDIDNLMCVSGGFHDAYIKKCDKAQDGSLYVLFDDVWGCQIEVWFDGDVSYDTQSRNPDIYDTYWLGSKIFIENGYIYLVDDEDAKVNNITDEHCWFKAKHMKYHVIPK